LLGSNGVLGQAESWNDLMERIAFKSDKLATTR